MTTDDDDDADDDDDGDGEGDGGDGGGYEEDRDGRLMTDIGWLNIDDGDAVSPRRSDARHDPRLRR